MLRYASFIFVPQLTDTISFQSICVDSQKQVCWIILRDHSGGEICCGARVTFCQARDALGPPPRPD